MRCLKSEGVCSHDVEVGVEGALRSLDQVDTKVKVNDNRAVAPLSRSMVFVVSRESRLNNSYSKLGLPRICRVFVNA